MNEKRLTMNENKLKIVNDCKELYFMIKKALKDNKNYDLIKHTLRSIVSVGSNIAEGNERGSKEFIRFIRMAKGSLSELKFQWSLFNINNEEINDKIQKITAMMINLNSSIVNRKSEVVKTK